VYDQNTDLCNTSAQLIRDRSSMRLVRLKPQGMGPGKGPGSGPQNFFHRKFTIFQTKTYANSAYSSPKLFFLLALLADYLYLILKLVSPLLFAFIV